MTILSSQAAALDHALDQINDHLNKRAPGIKDQFNDIIRFMGDFKQELATVDTRQDIGALETKCSVLVTRAEEIIRHFEQMVQSLYLTAQNTTDQHNKERASFRYKHWVIVEGLFTELNLADSITQRIHQHIDEIKEQRVHARFEAQTGRSYVLNASTASSSSSSQETFSQTLSELWAQIMTQKANIPLPTLDATFQPLYENIKLLMACGDDVYKDRIRESISSCRRVIRTVSDQGELAEFTATLKSLNQMLVKQFTLAKEPRVDIANDFVVIPSEKELVQSSLKFGVFRCETPMAKPTPRKDFETPSPRR